MNRCFMPAIIVELLALASGPGGRGQFGPTREQITPGVNPSHVIAIRAGRLFDGKAEP